MTSTVSKNGVTKEKERAGACPAKESGGRVRTNTGGRGRVTGSEGKNQYMLTKQKFGGGGAFFNFRQLPTTKTYDDNGSAFRLIFI